MSAVVAPEPSAEALALDALLRAVDDALDVCGDDERRVHLEGWRVRLQLELADALAV